MKPALDVSNLPDCTVDNNALICWGQYCLIAIETTMFLLLFAGFFYLRLNLDVWPPPGVEMPAVLVPTISLLVLVASAIPAHSASKAAKEGDRRGAILGLVLNIALALVFLVLRVIEWRAFNFKWNSDVFGSMVWAIYGLHTFDFLAMTLEGIVVLVVIATGRWGCKQRLAVHADGLTWYFIVAIWVPLYAAIYWGSRVVEAH